MLALICLPPVNSLPPPPHTLWALPFLWKPIKSCLVNITSPALTCGLGWCFVNLTEARVSWEKDLDWVSALVKLPVGTFYGVFCWLMVDVGGASSPWAVPAMSGPDLYENRLRKSWEKASKEHLSMSSASVPVFRFLLWIFPQCWIMIRVVSWNELLPSQVAFGHVILLL